jgi:mitotic spindle assembly checkpoint protein MAD1
MELDVMYEDEKTRLIKQQERDRETIKLLEDQIASFRKQGIDGRDEHSERRQTTESAVRYKLKKRIVQLQEEYAELDDQFKKVELTHKKCAAGERQISELEAQLALANEESASLKDRIKSLEGKVLEDKYLKHQVELSEHRFTQAQQRIKMLELEKDKQQAQELQFAEMKQEVAFLQYENRNLQDAVHNKLVLDKELTDLRSQKARFEEREQRLVKLEASHRHLESTLEHWYQVVHDNCLGLSQEKAIVGPELLRMKIESLQKKELLLAADKGHLESRLKTVEQEKRKIDTELCAARKQTEREKVINEERTNAIEHLQKRLQLVLSERDNYWSLLDMCPGVLNSQQQEQRSQIDALEKIVEGYCELVESLEGYLEKAVKGSGGIEYNDRIIKLEKERSTLLQEKEQFMKRRDELKVKLENRAPKGNNKPKDIKVLHFRMNPAALAEAQHENKLKFLEQECNRLRERVRVLEAGQTQDVTQAVNLNLAASNAQEVAELKGQLQSYEIRVKRMQETFKSTSQEFRDVCYMLLGYRIDRIKPKLYRLSSMYAESPNDHLLFELADNGPDLFETPYTATLETFINLHLKHQRSVPVFLSAITIDLFSHQTIDSSNEHSTFG